MSRLRVTVTFPKDMPPDQQVLALDDLAAALKAVLGLNGRLTRTAGLSLPGAPAALQPSAGPLRVFLLEWPDGESGAAMLRALGGWYMRNPAMEVTLKVDGPQGGASLQLKTFSMIGFAQAVARIDELTASPSGAG